MAFESGEKVLFLPDEPPRPHTGYRMGIPLKQMIVWDPYQEFGGTLRKRSTGAASSSGRATAPCTSASPRSKSSASPRASWHSRYRPIPNAASRSHSLPTKSARPRASSRLFSLRLLAPSGPLARKFIFVNRLSKELQTTESSRSIPAFALCTTMFRITPQHLLWALEESWRGQRRNCISVDERTRHHARVALDRMLALR